MRFDLKKCAAGVMLAAAAVTAQAGYTVTVDVAGISSNDVLGSAANELLSINAGAQAQLVGVSWNVDLFADSPSWLSELSVSFNGGRLDLAPGFADTNSGSGSYMDFSDLAALGLDFNLGNSGMLSLEFYEAFDDLTGADGVWRSGQIILHLIPEPSTYALVALGLLGVATRRQQRHA
jgi:hypothetical protein